MIVLPKPTEPCPPPDDDQRIFAALVVTHHRNLEARGVYGEMSHDEALVISVLGALATWQFPRSGPVLDQVAAVREEQEERSRANGVTKWRRERDLQNGLARLWDELMAVRGGGGNGK